MDPQRHRDFVLELSPDEYKVLRLDLGARTVSSAWAPSEPRPPEQHPPTLEGVRAAIATARTFSEAELRALGLNPQWSLRQTPETITTRVERAIYNLGPPHDDTYTGRRWRYDRVLDGPLPPGRIVGADGPSPIFGHGTVEYPRQLRPFEIEDLVLLGEVVDGQLVGPVVDAAAVTSEAVQTILNLFPDLDDRLRLTQTCRVFARRTDPRKLRDLVRLALEPGKPRGMPPQALRKEIAMWHAVKAMDDMLQMQLGAVPLDELLVKVREEAALATQTALAAQQDAAAAPVESPHVHRVGDKVYADTDFLRAVGALPGNEIRDLGMGEFTVETELGDVEFIRRDDAVTWPGKVGRAHLLSGTSEAIAGLLEQEAAASAAKAAKAAATAPPKPRMAFGRREALLAALDAAAPPNPAPTDTSAGDARTARRARLLRFANGEEQ